MAQRTPTGRREPVKRADAGPGQEGGEASADATRWWLALEIAVVSVACLVVLRSLAPGDALTAALPTGTDFTGHAVGVWVDRTNPASLLPGGWSSAAFAGYPANQLYPPFANALAALLSLVTSIGAGMKLAAILPLVLMPAAAWGAARLAALPQPLPVFLAVGAVPFVYDTSCSICGGNIASTIDGEYGYAWGLLLGLLAWGLVDRWLRTGRGVVLSVVVAGLASWSHPVTTAWMVVGLAALLVLRRGDWWAQRRSEVVLGAAAFALLALVWWLPFVWRHEWMPALGFPKRDDYLYWLFPASVSWELAITAAAVVGAVSAVRRRWTLLVVVTITAVLAALAFVAIPEGAQLFNLRVLPLWLFGRWLLAAVGVSVAVGFVAERTRLPIGLVRWAPVAALALVVAVLGTTWGWWFASTPPTDDAPGRSSVLGVEITAQSRGAALTFGGAEARPDAAAYADVRSMLSRAAASRGCGRMALDFGGPGGATPFGDVHLPEQVPIWTDGCITSLSGVYTDSSATTPAIYGALSLVSRGTGVSLPAITQFSPDLDAGLGRLRTLGVRYYLTSSPTIGSAHPTLTLVASASGWSLYEISEFAVVADTGKLPVVIDPRTGDGGWAALSMAYEVSQLYDQVPLVQDGPADWQRAAAGVEPGLRDAVTAGVHDVVATDDGVSFDVTTTGQPVVVRVSAFPGWTVDGAPEVLRSTPNSLVVVPSQTHVQLRHGRTPLDSLAMACGAAGIALLVVVAVRSRRRLRSSVPDAT